MATWYVSKSGVDDVSHGSASGSGAWATPGYALSGSRVSHGDTIIMEDDGGTPYPMFSTGTTVSIAFAGAKSLGAVEVRAATGASVSIHYPAAASGQVMTPNAGMHVAFYVPIKNPGGIAVALLKVVNSGATVEYHAEVDHGGMSTNCVQINAGSTSEVVIDGPLHGGIGTGVSNSSTAATIRYGGGARCYGWKIPLSSAGGTVIAEDGAILCSGTLSIVSNSGYILSAGHTLIDMSGAIIVCGGVFNSTALLVVTAAATYFRANPSAWQVESNVFYSYNFSGYYTDTIQEREDNCTNYATALAAIVWSSVEHIAVAPSNIFKHPGFSDTQALAGDFSGADFSTDRSVSLASDHAFVGDSIMHGWGASDDELPWASQTKPCWAVYAAQTGQSVADSCAIPGILSGGCQWLVDWVMQHRAPSMVYVACGINNFEGTVTPTNITGAQVAVDMAAAMEKIELWGAKPAWLGITSNSGATPNNSQIDALNAAMITICADNGWLCGVPMLDLMRQDAAWATKYYTDLSTDVHPDDDGHALISESAEILLSLDRTGTHWGLRVPFDGTLPALTTESKFAITRTVKSEGKPLTANQVTKYVEEDLK